MAEQMAYWQVVIAYRRKIAERKITRAKHSAPGVALTSLSWRLCLRIGRSTRPLRIIWRASRAIIRIITADPGHAAGQQNCDGDNLNFFHIPSPFCMMREQ